MLSYYSIVRKGQWLIDADVEAMAVVDLFHYESFEEEHVIIVRKVVVLHHESADSNDRFYLQIADLFQL